jgi:hypothetical protein
MSGGGSSASSAYILMGYLVGIVFIVPFMLKLLKLIGWLYLGDDPAPKRRT